MSKRKRNHYIPRFYLRNFTDIPTAENGKFDFLNIKTGKYIGIIPHGSQMQETYFYEKSSDIENMLGDEFEGKHACLVKDILGKQQEFDPAALLEIVLLMHFRTKAQRDEDLFFRKNVIDRHLIDHMTSGFRSYLEKELPQLAGIWNDADLKKAVRKEAYGQYLKETDSAGKQIKHFKELRSEMDGLNAVILNNLSLLNLVSSDRPVLLLNPFLNRRKAAFGKDGMLQMGILLILPLNPQKIIVCYDPKIYKNPLQVSEGILTENDVKNLNKLQVLCGVEGVYSKMLPTGFCQTVTEILDKKVSPKLVTAHFPGGYELMYKDNGLPNIDFSFVKEMDGTDDIKLTPPYARR